MRRTLIFGSFIVSILFLNALPFVTHAQFGGVVGTPSFLSVEPTNPAPEQSVTATFESYSTDLNAADISWFVNGQLQKRGIGIKTFTFQTGPSGKETSLRVTARTIEGDFIEKTLSFNPASVELFFEAETYTPPFYKGKALHTHQGNLRVIALPHFIASNGTRINASNLLYTWKKDGVVLQDASGFGKQSTTVNGNIIIRPITVEVTVTTTDGVIKGVARQTFRSDEAKVLVYEESPLYGIHFGRAMGQSFDLSQDETTLTAIPYFFSINSGREAKFSWFMNSQSINESDASVTFRNETGEAGVSRISIKGENISKILQFASSAFTINFSGTNEDSSFFGQQ